jgi:hypothetical protein
MKSEEGEKEEGRNGRGSLAEAGIYLQWFHYVADLFAREWKLYHKKGIHATYYEEKSSQNMSFTVFISSATFSWSLSSLLPPFYVSFYGRRFSSFRRRIALNGVGIKRIHATCKGKYSSSEIWSLVPPLHAYVSKWALRARGGGLAGNWDEWYFLSIQQVILLIKYYNMIMISRPFGFFVVVARKNYPFAPNLSDGAKTRYTTVSRSLLRTLSMMEG